MSLFKCFNPACLREFRKKGGVLKHMEKNNICAEYAAATVLYASSDESDSDTGSISLEVVEGNNNIIDNNDNFSIGIDDDDDDDNSESKRQRISELYNESEIKEDRSFPISTDHLVKIMTPFLFHQEPTFNLPSYFYSVTHPFLSIYILRSFV